MFKGKHTHTHTPTHISPLSGKVSWWESGSISPLAQGQMFKGKHTHTHTHTHARAHVSPLSGKVSWWEFGGISPLAQGQMFKGKHTHTDTQTHVSPLSGKVSWWESGSISPLAQGPSRQTQQPQYFRCRGKRLPAEGRSGGLAGPASSESRLKRSLPVRRICSSSFLCRFMSERTLSRRASRFWLRAELPEEGEGEKCGRESGSMCQSCLGLSNHLGSLLNRENSRPVVKAPFWGILSHFNFLVSFWHIQLTLKVLELEAHYLSTCSVEDYL